VANDGPGKSSGAGVPVRLTFSTTLLLIGAIFVAFGLLRLFEAAQRPIGWLLAASIVAWLLTSIIDALDRWIPRGPAIALTALGFVVFAGGSWVGVRATIRSEVDRLRTALPSAAHDLEARHHIAAEFHLAQRTQAFVDSIDARFGTKAEVLAAAGTASTYFVTGVLMLFLVGYGPRFIESGLRQISDSRQRAMLVQLVHQASTRARAYLLLRLAQIVVVTGVCAVVFYVLELPAPFILGLSVGWLSVIPYMGVLLGGLAPLLAAATEPHGFTYPVIVTLLLALQTAEIAVIRPRLDARTLKVGPALIIVGFLVGLEVYGLGGAIYGTAALVFAWAVIQAIPQVRQR